MLVANRKEVSVSLTEVKAANQLILGSDSKFVERVRNMNENPLDRDDTLLLATILHRILKLDRDGGTIDAVEISSLNEEVLTVGVDQTAYPEEETAFALPHYLLR